MKRPRIGLIGHGVVGSATRQLLHDFGHKDFGIFDPKAGHHRPDEIDDCSIVFISVPVPTLHDGTQDLTILKEALGRCQPTAHVFIRSSVLPRTVESLLHDSPHLNIYALPEFLTERTAEKDVRVLPLVCSVDASKLLQDLMPGKRMLVLQDESSCEFAKYIHNAFCAMKVGFFNTIFQLATSMKLDYGRAVNAACEVTSFVGHTHTKVPGPDGATGFGGKCLPKDLLALSTLVENVTGKKTFFRTVLDENFYNRFQKLF